MPFLAESNSISRSLLLDGSNYPYWKARMKAFIKALDEKAWRSLLTAWTHPTTKDDKGKLILKLEVSWSSEDDRLANYNSKVLHTIFNVVDDNQIKLIAPYEFAKETLDILQTTHEETSDIKRSNC